MADGTMKPAKSVALSFLWPVVAMLATQQVLRSQQRYCHLRSLEQP